MHTTAALACKQLRLMLVVCRTQLVNAVQPASQLRLVAAMCGFGVAVQQSVATTNTRNAG